MSAIRQEAILMVQSMPENQLQFIVNIMRDLSRFIPTNEEQVNTKEQAFAFLESMRKKIPDFDYDQELAEYREGRYR